MSYSFRPGATEALTVTAEFLDREGAPLEGGSVSWVVTHPAFSVDDHGDGTASVKPAEPTVATDAQLFAVWRSSDGVDERTSAPFGLQAGQQQATGQIVATNDPNSVSPSMKAAPGEAAPAQPGAVTEPSTPAPESPAGTLGPEGGVAEPAVPVEPSGPPPDLGAEESGTI